MSKPHDDNDDVHDHSVDGNCFQPSQREERKKERERESIAIAFIPITSHEFFSRVLCRLTLCKEEERKHKLSPLSFSLEFCRQSNVASQLHLQCMLCMCVYIYVCVCSGLNCVLSVRSSTGRSIIPPHH